MPASKFAQLPDLARLSPEELRQALRELHATMAELAAENECLRATQHPEANERLNVEIAERKRAEQVLSEQEKIYRMLFDLSPAGILVLNSQGHILDANETLARTSGYTRRELIGQNVRIFATPEQLARVPGHLELILGGHPLEHEVVNVRKDGTRRAIRLHETAIPLPDGSLGVLSIAEDVTERRQAERVLREAHGELEKRVRSRTAELQSSEARFRALFESAPVGIAQGDVASIRFINANQRYCDIVGYTRDELQSLNFKDFTHPDDLPADLDNLARLLAGEVRQYRMEKRFIRRDGKIVWCSLTVAALWSPGESPDCFIAVLEDINARKQAEEALRESEQKYHQLFDTLQEGIWAIDRAANTSFVNPHMARMLGYTVAEMEGRPLFSFMDERGVELSKRNLERRQQGIAEQHDFELLHKDGHRVYVTMESSPLMDRDGKYVGALAGVMDITMRKKTEAALRMTAERLREGVRVAGFGIFDHDHLTDRIFYSAAMREIHGFKPSDPITLPAVMERTLPADRPRFIADVKRAHDPAGDGLFNSEHRIVRPDGTIRWVNSRSQTTFAGEGAERHPVRTFGASVDITERKQAEENLRRAHDELEKRVAERTMELARANQRLTVEIAERMALQEEILTAGERERQRLGQNLHDGVCQILTAARLKADSLVTILTDAKPSVARNIQSVAHLVAQAVEDAHGLARGLEPVEPLPEGLMGALRQLAASVVKLFHVRCDCEFPQPVLVYDHKVATELFRIAQEAANNAIKHGRAKAINIRLTRKAGETILTISNNGKPFPQQPRTTGMGLKTMRFRSSRIGANLDISKGPRGGTVVSCTLRQTSLPAPAPDRPKKRSVARPQNKPGKPPYAKRKSARKNKASSR